MELRRLNPASLEAQRCSKPGRLKQQVEGVHRPDHKKTGIQNCLERATLPVLNRNCQPSGLFHDFQVQPVVIPVTEGCNVAGIQPHGITPLLDVLVLSLEPSPNNRQAFQFFLRCPEGIRSDT